MAPKRQPDHLRSLSGGNKSGYDRDVTPPEIEPDTPRCPAFLKDESRKAWKELVPGLVEMGIIGKVSRPALICLVDAYADYIEARDIKLVESPICDPRKRRREARKHLISLLSEFGLTPSSLSGLNCPAPNRKKKDKKLRFWNEQ